MESVLKTFQDQFARKKSIRNQELKEQAEIWEKEVGLEIIENFLKDQKLKDRFVSFCYMFQHFFVLILILFKLYFLSRFWKIVHDDPAEFSRKNVNFVLGFLAGQCCIKNASRSGEFANATIDEFNNKTEEVDDETNKRTGTIINIADKSSYIKS